MNHKCTILLALAWSSLPLAAADPFQSIPFDQLGAAAERQSPDNGNGITLTATGAKLKAVMQDLEAEAAPDGLWLTSMADEDAGKPKPFRIKAMAAGRDKQISTRFGERGTVTTTPEIAVFLRPGLVEEYRVSTDGVRQDFLVHERPAGNGELMLELQICGAKAAAADFGAKLTVDGSGRELAYSRLKVTDATGRELAARMAVESAVRVRIHVEDTAAIYPVRIDPTFSDANWVNFGPAPGTNESIRALAFDGLGNLYVGGQFTTAGGVAASLVAKWDGNAWSSLGTGIGGYYVSALAMLGGNLYAGGWFVTAGGNAASNVAKWNGSAWSALGSGADSEVTSFAVSGGNLYAGGMFTFTGGILTNNIAKWNGTAWSKLGTGINGSVRALAVIAGNVYAGGFIYEAGGEVASNIARWDGSAWSPLGEGVDGQVLSLAVYGSDLYAGGHFTMAGEVPANRIARWNGTAWSALGAGTNSPVRALAVSGSNVYAGGDFTEAGGLPANRIARWDGSAWSSLGSGLGGGGVLALAVDFSSPNYQSEVVAAGSFTTANGRTANRVAKWNQADWTEMRPALNGAVWALAAEGGNLYLGGDFTSVAGIPASRIAKWNGSNWSTLGTGMDGRVRVLEIVGGNLYAGGNFTTAGGTTANRIAKWNGTAWSSLGTGMSTSGFGSSVSALAASGTDLYAGGDFIFAGGVTVFGIAKWNGTAWSALGSGMGGAQSGFFDVKAIAVSGGDLYAGGYFDTAGGVPAKRIARWNGSAWFGLGTGLSVYFGGGPFVSALAVNGGNLYVGGYFQDAGGVRADGIARWNGSNWASLGGVRYNSSSGGVVYALKLLGGDLYVSGSFNQVGAGTGVIANSIAKWNGSSWSALGSGFNGSALALAVDGGDFYAGGDFTKAGGLSSAYVAKAVLPPPDVPGFAVEQPAGSPLTSGTVPFGTVVLGSATSRTFTLRNTGNVDLTVIAASENGTDFSVSLIPPPTLAVGGSSEFTVNFAPGAAGTRNAVLTISTNETAATPFTVALAGEGITAQAVFASVVGSSGLTGAAAQSDAIPFGDGVENLLKYAFNMNLAGPDSHGLIPGTGNSGLPSIGLTGIGPATMIRVEFLRRKGSGLVYTPKRSSNLQPGSFVPFGTTPAVTSINDNWERVVVQESADPATLPASFALVEVTLP